MTTISPVTPHDVFFRSNLSDLPTARDFLSTYIPETLLPLCDMNTLRLEQGSFVDPDLRAFHSDILWSLQTTDGPGYIYALIEHQSSPDKHMAFRLMRYAFGAMKQHLDAGHDTLPLVIPLLFYHGRSSPYPHRLNWLQEFARPDLACHLYGRDLPLIDVTVMPDDVIMGHRRNALLEFVQKHIRQRDLCEMLEGLVQLFSREYTGPDQIATSLTYLLRSGNVADARAFIRDLSEQVPQHEGAVMTGAEQLEKIGLEKGMERGMERGLEQGLALGIKQGIEKGIEQGIEQGMAQGREQGLIEGKLDVARAMLAEGLDSTTIQRITMLSDVQLAAISR